MRKIYKYGMRLRGFSLGCQPLKGLLKIEDPEPPYGRYHDILYYGVKLSDKDVHDYELDYLGEVETIC